MILIRHRINTIKELIKTDFKYGIEIDVRSNNNKLYLSHNPFKKGVNFDLFIKKYNHSFLIVNIKEEGIEFKILKKLKEKKIKNFFLLDVTIPQSLKIKKEKKIACRISQFESMQGSINLAKRRDWIWLDTLNGDLPISFDQIKKLKKRKFKICLVSPELPMKKKIYLRKLKKKINKQIVLFDAICTKYPNIWEL